MVDMLPMASQRAAVPVSEGSAQGGKVLRWVRNERMGGMVPSWGPAETAAEKMSVDIAQSAQGAHQGESFAHALAYRDGGAALPSPVSAEEAFGFRDLIDLVNPLQHIPLVNVAYREITGDKIRPSGQIIGGALFGGALGAAGGLVNAVVEEETGDDIAGNALSFARGDDVAKPEVEIDMQAAAKEMAAIEPSGEVQRSEAEYYKDLPVALLSFAQKPLSPVVPEGASSRAVEKESNGSRHYIRVADGRTAGMIIRYA